jgi:hypothetical protein
MLWVTVEGAETSHLCLRRLCVRSSLAGLMWQVYVSTVGNLKEYSVRPRTRAHVEVQFVKFKVKVILRLTVLVSGTHLDPRPIFPVLSLIIFGKLRVCWCEAPSLTRGRVCNLQRNDASSIWNLQRNDASSIWNYIATDGLSASSSWCQAPNGVHDQIWISLFDNFFLLGVGLPRPYPSWTGWSSPKSKSKVKLR